MQTYNHETERDVYGGSLSCGEVELNEELIDDETSDTESYVVTIGGGKRNTSKRISGGDEECGECSIAVDGPVCSDERAIVVIKNFLRQKEYIPDSTQQSEIAKDAPIEIITSAKKITKCNTEECVLLTIARENPATKMIITETIRDNFKANGPADSTKWLNNSNIDDILAQLVRKHPSIYRMPFHMIDFEDQKVPNGAKTLKNISLIKDVINAGKNMFCVVINTDKYGNPGLHWFAIFCDFRSSPFTIEYFNSSGASAPLRIKDWMKRAELELEAGGYPVKLITAAVIQHQRSDTECGVYSLYYIYRRIKDASVEEFATRIPDSEMIAFRRKLFRNRETSPAN